MRIPTQVGKSCPKKETGFRVGCAKAGGSDRFPDFFAVFHFQMSIFWRLQNSPKGYPASYVFSNPHMIAFFLRHPARQALPCLLLLFALTSCDRVSSRMEITRTREISQYETKPKVGAYAQERFGDERLIWQTPEGWSQAERSQMRPVNLTFGPSREGECYLSLLPGGGGGVLANVNRWRKQMGQPEITEEELAKMPKKTLMGIEGTFVSIEGAYTSVGATESKPDHKMLGIVAAMGEAGLFVKMVGPKALVEANSQAFDQFVTTLRLRMPQGQ